MKPMIVRQQSAEAEKHRQRHRRRSHMMPALSLALCVCLFVFNSKASQSAEQQNDIDRCSVIELKKSQVQGLKVYAPDGKRYLINAKDERGIAQIYIGQDGSSDLSCITCEDIPHGPKRQRFKMQPVWHPSGEWIFLAVERDHYSPPPVLGGNREFVEGQLQTGLWTNMHAGSPATKQWRRLTDFVSGVPGMPDGYTGPAFTPDGKHAVWSQVVDGNIFVYWPFGRWELILADVEMRKGIPKFSNLRNITPAGMHWNEPGNFHPDGESLLFTGSDQLDAQGMDQYILNIRTGALSNLTRSPQIWDEHGVFSPDGKKILFMSAYPYRSDPNSSTILGIKTEFMLMDNDGSNLTQLTRFLARGNPEYSVKGGIAANGVWTPDGRSLNLLQLYFPNYDYWDLTFQGACGNNGSQ
jgi:hypothetical protein